MVKTHKVSEMEKEEHEIDVVNEPNGLVRIVIGLGDDLMCSRRMSRWAAGKLGRELVEASKGAKEPEKREKAEVEPEDKEILREIKKTRLPAGTDQIEEGVPFEEEKCTKMAKNDEKPGKRGRPATNCAKCRKKLGKRIFRNSEGKAVHRGCRED